MYNENIRKLTSLTLMAVMFAGGMTFAMPGMVPSAYAAGELTVSAEAVGNFAGIQVIEIVVNDPDRSDTSESQGIPNVEINGDDILMAQGDDGAWYAYVAEQQAIDAYGTTAIIDIYGGVYDTTPNHITTDAESVFNGTKLFLDGYKELSPLATNNPEINDSFWPFIQTYDISDGSDVTITYGTGSNAESVTISYDYDDDKDISLDRTRYPAGSFVMLTLDDSLLNLSPTADDYWAFNSTNVYYLQDSDTALSTSNQVDFAAIGFEEGPLKFNVGSSLIFSIQNSTVHDTILEGKGNAESVIILRQSNTDDNIFVNYDTRDISNIVINSDDAITGSGNISYNDGHSIIADTFNGIISFSSSLVDEWLSGVEIDLELIDEDKNLNSRIDEDLLILDGETPYMNFGDPLTIDEVSIYADDVTVSVTIDQDSSGNDIITNSKVAQITLPISTKDIIVQVAWPADYGTSIDSAYIFPYINFDFSEFDGPSGTFYTGNRIGLDEDAIAISISDVTINSDTTSANFTFALDNTLAAETSANAYFDLFFFGQEAALANTSGELNDNVDRVNDALYRFELEETDDNTAKFTGTVEYIMINQLNVFDVDTYDGIDTASDSVVFIVNDDLDGSDAPRVSYNDVISTGNDETISVQEDANTHTGSIKFDSTSYSSGNTIIVTLTDADLNTDSDTPQIYEVFNTENWVGDANVWLAQLTFDDRLYEGCGTTTYPDQKDLGLNATSFSFIETDDASGVFVGTLRLPTTYCNTDSTNSTTNGVDIEFEYQDYSDSSGNPNETQTGAAVQSNTGKVALDKTVYGLPFGDNEYLLHASNIDASTNYLDATPTSFTIQVDDPDYNISANGEDTIPIEQITFKIKRGSDTRTVVLTGFGDLVEIDPQAGIFEVDITVDQGSSSFATLALGGLIQQGDIITVQYTDLNDASGESNTVTDSATFDLRNAVLQTDKPIYIIGSDAIITLIEPDLNLDSETEETLSLDLIEWDSDAGTTTLANKIFNAQPAGLRETGPDTGIFQVVIEIPQEIDSGDKLERGEQIFLEYTDQGPAGADFVGDDEEDITVNISTSDFGASIELDQKVYSWTDKVYITIVSPDHNFDNNSIDEIGGEDKIIQINTRGHKLDNYKFVETGPDTGIFTGEVILTGFTHDADGDGDPTDTSPDTSGTGPTDGFLETSSDDGITVSFEASDNEVFTGSALIRWNIGEVQFLEASYPASGNGIVRVIDSDMNLNPESVDSFDINVWSDSSAGGIALRVTETNEATGIFEGSMIFTTTDSSSGSRLRVAEGDVVVAEYEDNTLPDPYSDSDELDITATTLIGTIVPPLERAPAANLRAVDAFGNSLSTIRVDQQIQVTADLSNNQDRDQDFAYLLQVQDEDGVTVSLSWITGSLNPGQKLSPAVSWVPATLGEYTATAFVWQSVDNPTALSPPVTTVLNVNS